MPSAYQEQVRRYSRTRDQTGRGSKVEDSPFQRYVDVWMTAVCVAVAEGLPVEVPPTVDTWRFEYGARLQGESTWIDLLQMLAIRHYRDPHVISDARKVIDLANAYAAAGLPYVIEMLETGHREQLWNLTFAMMEVVEKSAPELPRVGAFPSTENVT